MYEWLRERSFVRVEAGGLVPHDLVREVLLADLSWTDPVQDRRLAARAVDVLVDSFDTVGADAAHVLDEIYFAAGGRSLILAGGTRAEYAAEPLRPEDWPAAEQMTLRLQRAAGSLAITPTRPSTYPQVILWGEPAWLKFREVMERLYTPEQLGPEWQNAGKGIMYDHVEVAHLYLTPKIIREAPAEYFAVKLAATRQIWVASGGRPPACEYTLTTGARSSGDRAQPCGG